MPISDANRSPREWLGRNPRFRIRLISGGNGLVLVAATLALWHFSLTFLNLPLHEATRQHTRLITERLTNYLDGRLTLLKSINRFYTLSESMLSQREFNTDYIRRFLNERQFLRDNTNRFLDETDFQKFCASTMLLTPGMLAVLLSDTDGIPIWIAPDPPGLNPQDIFWLTTDPRFTGALNKMGEDNEAVLTEPINLPMHGQGLLAAVPVMINQRHLGFIVGIIPFQDLVNYLILPGLREDFYVRIEQANQTIYPTPAGAKSAAPVPGLWTEASISNKVRLGNQQWSVTITPLRASKYSPFNFVSLCIAGLGLCLSALSTYLVHRVLWRAVRLQSEASDQRSRLERTGLTLLEVQTQLNLIINSVDEGIILYDEQLTPVQANTAFLTMFHLTENSRAMTDGRLHHQQLVRMLGRETRYWTLFEALKRDPVRTFGDEIETPLPKDDKVRRERSFLRRAVAVTGPHDALHGILVIYRDITMIKDIERVKDDFLSNVTHELRSPLSSIKGFAEMIKRDPGMPGETREEFISIICEESERLQRLIEELLDLRRLQSQGMPLRIVPYDLKVLVEDAVRGTHSVTHAKNIRIEVAWDGLDNARLRGDVAQIGRALRNLLVNAVKYSPPGGTIQVRGNAGLQWVGLEVIDQGTGIDEKDLPYIFDQFYRGTSKGRQKGTGLGLAIVKHTVELHGGHLGVRSEVGHGTHFRIELPRDFQPPGQIAAAVGGIQTPAGVADPAGVAGG